MRESNDTTGRGAAPKWLPFTLLVLLIVAVTIGWALRGRIGSLFSETEGGSPASAGESPAEGREGSALPHSLGGEEPRSARGARSAEEAAWEAALGRRPEWPVELVAPSECRAIERDLDLMCSAIDSDPTFAALAVPGGACGLLRGAAADLAASPPPGGAGYSDVTSLVTNVIHLAQVLGSERTVLLRGLVDEQDELTEPIALTLYRYAASRDVCGIAQGDASESEALYEYAAFLVNSVGGQGYLARRMPKQAALAQFYALVEIDRAEKEGRNRHGIDVVPHAARCEALIAGQPLIFKDRYLDLLDRMKRR